MVKNISSQDNQSYEDLLLNTRQHFLIKLFELLKDKSINDTISWNNKGDAFIIKNSEKFRKILPNWFRTNNYSSFLRQLNMYGFHKIKNKEGLEKYKLE